MLLSQTKETKFITIFGKEKNPYNLQQKIFHPQKSKIQIDAKLGRTVLDSFSEIQLEAYYVDSTYFYT